jgi:hypothetical protein
MMADLRRLEYVIVTDPDAGMPKGYMKHSPGARMLVAMGYKVGMAAWASARTRGSACRQSPFAPLESGAAASSRSPRPPLLQRTCHFLDEPVSAAEKLPNRCDLICELLYGVLSVSVFQMTSFVFVSCV